MNTPLPVVMDEVLFTQLVAFRRDVHQHPELAFEEQRTAALVADFLDGLGLVVQRGVGRTGVVALLDSGKPGPTIGLRADMDALPVQEAGDLAFRSVTPNVSHCCGHDLHSAIVLGAAALLQRDLTHWGGRIKLLFQPAEETLQGARAMIADDVMNAPLIDVMLGAHNSPDLAADKVAFIRGASMAASNAFDIRVSGKSGHAAHPQTGTDALQAVAMLIDAVNRIAIKEFPAHVPRVLSLGVVKAGRARNIICEDAWLEGTCRTLDAGVTDVLETALRRACRGIAEATATSIELEWRRMAPPLVNHLGALDIALTGVRRVLGAEQVVEYALPSMGSEDFSWYGAHAPLVHLRIGSMAQRGATQLHQSTYEGNEQAIATGARALAAAAMELAQRWPGSAGPRG